MEGRSLFVSDVDGTLLGERERDLAALEEFAAWRNANGDRVAVVYNSGRFFASVAESVRETPLPAPDAVIGGVGTEIRWFASGELIDAWTATFEDWNAKSVRSTLSQFAEEGLELQPDEFQSELKISYYARDAPLEQRRRWHQAVEAAGVDAKMVYSSNRDLDVLPAAADKGTAAAFVVRHWGCSPDNVVVAGDTGNDLGMFQHGFRGIVVANAHEELRALRAPNIYHSPHECAAGVLDGLRHWRL